MGNQQDSKIIETELGISLVANESVDLEAESQDGNEAADADVEPTKADHGAAKTISENISERTVTVSPDDEHFDVELGAIEQCIETAPPNDQEVADEDVLSIFDQDYMDFADDAEEITR